MKYDINLAPRASSNFLQRIFYFFSNYLRYILVITQLVVIGTLFARFQLDQNIIDLKESIEQKKEIVKTASFLVNEADRIETKTNSIRSVTRNQSRLIEMMEYVFGPFPQDLFLSSLEVNNLSLRMTGVALDATQLQLFFNFLKKDKRFVTITLEDLKKGDDGYTFIIALNNFRSTKN